MNNEKQYMKSIYSKARFPYLALMLFIIIISAGLLIVYIIRRPTGIEAVGPIPPGWSIFLMQKVRFFRSLDKASQQRFMEDMAKFLNTVKIVGVSTEVTIEDRLLVASSAVIPLFGFPQWRYQNLDEVILYPSAFDKEFNFEDPKEFINGMVGEDFMEGKMILSKQALHAGYENSQDKMNVGIHEFIHLFDKEDGDVNGIPPVFHEQTFTIPWMKLIKTEIQKIIDNDSDIRRYGATHVREFFAVAGEYFFERPHLLKVHHPELYRMMALAFNQRPDTFMPIRQAKANEIGRNSQCPCGSGEKYKHCCGRE